MAFREYNLHSPKNVGSWPVGSKATKFSKPDQLKEATRIKSNVYFLDLVDLELTYFG